ncbi:response regulator [Sphingomonas sp. AR_OL41]|uniref:response regulator transcription factor n=1 Tax=Sphingomonas sp. AR_OL41 TaxID=3042729 RepID=UPI0024808252|nr:response regulator [Sphingomonas sp. AR_OL41]MDH7973280.1 response regulator [Sphingomonas sp. AR_OL41]
MKIVYVVDDDEIVRALIHSALSARGDAHIYLFASGNAFVDMLDGLEEGVLLLDIHMPGLSGIDVLEHLATSDRSLRTVVMTAKAEIPLAVRAMKLGAADFIEKPFTMDDLTALIDGAFDELRDLRDETAPRDEARARIDRLSQREREVLARLVTGLSNKEIAVDLDLSPRTVEIHRANVMSKIEADSLAAAIRTALAADTEEFA